MRCYFPTSDLNTISFSIECNSHFSFLSSDCEFNSHISHVYSDICINTSVISISNQFILVQQCDTIRNKFFKCTYVHLCYNCYSTLCPSNIQHLWCLLLDLFCLFLELFRFRSHFHLVWIGPNQDCFILRLFREILNGYPCEQSSYHHWLQQLQHISVNVQILIKVKS